MIEATITFLNAGQGGITTPVRSGYRPQIRYMGEEWEVEHTYPDQDVVHAGDTVNARLRFSGPHLIHEGMPFQVRDERRIVGYGVITKIK